MKNITLTLSASVLFVWNAFAQIPNSGFENWTTANGRDSLIGWHSANITKSTDHYPPGVGQYAINMNNSLPVVNHYSYGYSATFNSAMGCYPSFPISGRPSSFHGYYKCNSLNNDTIQIGLMLYYQGEWVAGAEFITTTSVSNWTSFSVPISPYTNADSASISVAAFYNDTTCGAPHGPFGNSELYIDNLSFDSLHTTVAGLGIQDLAFNIYPNPSAKSIHVEVPESYTEDLTVQIYYIDGSLVKSATINQHNQQIDIEALSNGVYMVFMRSSDAQGVQRLLIQK